jgi:hypothetical protein
MNGGQWAIRNFLICQPAPATIKLTGQEGEIQTMTPGRKSRAKLAETIAAMEPALIECLASDGSLLRAMRPGDESTKARSVEAPVAKGLEGDPTAAMLSHFANLLHRAYEHATDIAFDKLIELVERMDERTNSIEARLERTEANLRREQHERIDDLWEQAEQRAADAGGSKKDAILESLAAGIINGKAATASNNAASSNGKGSS